VDIPIEFVGFIGGFGEKVPKTYTTENSLTALPEHAPSEVAKEVSKV
jgi:hypothetical protein